MVPQQQRRRRRRAALPRTSERRVIVARGAGGFGFTIAGQRPCVVSAVAAGGPAERAGLRAGDALLAVDGASVARAPHASVARLVAAVPGAIALSVAPRDAPPTDTEDTEPDERARTRRRHPPPRRRPQAMLHHPACHAAPSTSGVNEILQNLSRAQLTPNHVARLECRAVVGYLGTIETPQAASTSAPNSVRSAVRKLRQERRPAAPVLLSVLPGVLLLRRPSGRLLAQYPRDRILYAGSGSDADRRFFGLVTSAETSDAEASHSCHIFAVDPRMAEHDAHSTRAREFQVACTRDPVAERCLEFPPSAEYVVGVVRGMYSLPADDCVSPLQQISKLAIKGDSPAMGNFSRCSRAVLRVPRDRRAWRQEDARLEAPDFSANSPQPSNHSEMTTTSSNSDSGIGFHNDCRNIADRILVVDFAGQQPPPNRFRRDMPRRPMGLVGCGSFDAEVSFLSNTTPVVDGFGGQGRPLNLDDIMLNANDLQPVRHVSPRNEDDNYNYNNVYGNLPSTSRSYNGVVYDQVYTENEGNFYEMLPPQLELELDRGTDTFQSVELYEERGRSQDCQSNESVENETVISGGTSKASMDSVSMYSSRSHEDAPLTRRKHLQASLDDMLVLSMRGRDSPQSQDKDAGIFLHPASVKCKVRKSMKPLNILMRTRHMLTGRDKKEDRRRAMSASAGDVAGARAGEGEGGAPLPAAASEPDLRETQILAALSFFATGSYQKPVGMSYLHGLSQASVSKAVKEVTRALNNPRILGKHIGFPQTPQERQFVINGFFNKFGFPGCLGCIDGTHVALIKPTEHEERFFNRKHFHSRNVQIICDSDLNILNVDASFGGATHDAHIWRMSELQRHVQDLHSRGEAVWLLGDSGYPLRPWLLTPIVNAEPGSADENYTNVHCLTRNTVERCIGVLKARWRCLLAHRVLHYDHHTVAMIINACAVLHNICNKHRLPVPQLPSADSQEDQRNQIPHQSLGDTGSTAGGEQELLAGGRQQRNRIVQRLWSMRSN